MCLAVGPKKPMGVTEKRVCMFVHTSNYSTISSYLVTKTWSYNSAQRFFTKATSTKQTKNRTEPN